MAEPQERPSPPPYLSKKTYDGFLESLRIGVPGQIDRSLLRTYSGSAQTALLQGLRYLHLIDAEGVPTQLLHKVLSADGAHAATTHREIIKGAYPFLFRSGFELKTATPRMLEQAFAEAGAQGDTIRKCIAFFVLYAKDAEVPLSPHLKTPIVRATRSTPRKKSDADNKTVALTGVAAAGAIGTLSPASVVQAQTPSQMLLDILNPEMETEEQNAVWTLLKYLKRTGR